MLKCPKCGSENIDYWRTSDEIKIWCDNCGHYVCRDLPSVYEIFPEWNDDDDEDEE